MTTIRKTKDIEIDIPSPYNSIAESRLNAEINDNGVNSWSKEITFIELAILNGFLYKALNTQKFPELNVKSYGSVGSNGLIDFSYAGGFDVTYGFWFNVALEGDKNDYYIQTRTFTNSHNELVVLLHISSKVSVQLDELCNTLDKVTKLAFNNSEYKGKCVKIKLKDGRFRGIEIIDISESANELILNTTQKKYIEHFIRAVGRGRSIRYLLNGEPGTGKTETIREIARMLIPNVTFIIPDFNTTEDLTSIMEACEIFDNSVIIMDDIDLFLGSRDNGSYTRLLGQFLSFFDGVKKRKISLLASTNDKGLVDKAAERPGRFNLTIDYGFLNKEQIELVCKIHLDKKWHKQEVYDALTSRINGKEVKITGAFIANLADNIREMSEDENSWDITDTVSLIIESYKGFYSSQVEKEKSNLGFKI